MAEATKQTTVVKACRERKPNFSDTEIGIILEGVCEHKDLLNHPDNSTSINRQKEAVYKRITEKVNEVTSHDYGGSVFRNPKEIKKKWIELKSNALKIHNAKYGESEQNKLQQSKQVPKENPFTQLVLDVLSGKAKVGITDFKAESYTTNFRRKQEDKNKHNELDCGAFSNFNPININAEHADNTFNIKTEMQVKPKSGESVRLLDEMLLSEKVGKSKRERKQNFTDMEITVLLREVNRHRDIILLKDQNSDMIKEKHQKWLHILDCFHKACETRTKRTLIELQKKWRNMKLAALKERKVTEAPLAEYIFSPHSQSSYTEQVIAVLDGTFDDSSEAEVQEVDFEVMLNLDDSANQHQLPLPKQSRSNEPALQVGSTNGNKKQDKRAHFSEAEILCLLKEMPKHHKILGSKLQSDRTDHLKEVHWQIITDKVNTYSDAGVVRTWKEVQQKFKALKLAALATKNQRSFKGRMPQRNGSLYVYDQLVLDILNKGNKTNRGSKKVGISISQDSLSSNETQEENKRECVFPKRNYSKDMTMSVEECECLVNEIDKFMDVLLGSTFNEVDDLQQRQHQAWRIITEKVNKCAARDFRWAARDMKLKWLELRQDVESYQNAVDQGIEGVTKPVLFHKINHILQKAFSNPAGNVADETDNSNSQFGSSLELISRFSSKDDDSGNVSKSDSHSLESENEKGMPEYLKENNIMGEESDGDKQVDDPEDSDYLPTVRRHLKKNYTTRLSPRLRKPLNPRKFTRTLPVVERPLASRRCRKPNFSEAEVKLMLDVYEANKDVLNSKKLDSVTNSKKLRIWQTMAEKVNKLEGQETRRTLKQVRKKLKDMRSSAIKYLINGSENISDGKSPWQGRPVVERIVNVMDIGEMESENFEVFGDLVEENEEVEESIEENAELVTDDNSSATIQQLMDSLSDVCFQLKELGVDAGAVIFEEGAVISCGSDRLTRIAAHPQLAEILSVSTNQTTNRGNQKGSTEFAGGWEVTVIGSDSSLQEDKSFEISVSSDVSADQSAAYPGAVLAETMEVADCKSQILDGTSSKDKTDGINKLKIDTECLGEATSLVGSEDDDVTDVKKKLKELIRNRSWDADSALQPVTEVVCKKESDLQHPIVKASFRCNMCPASFPHLSDLILHKYSHREQKPDADIMLKEKKQTEMVKSPITLLMQQVEKTPREFPCRVCGKRFIKGKHLEIHMRRHSGLKPFACDLCPATFVQRGGLILHKKAKHTVPKHTVDNAITVVKTAGKNDDAEDSFEEDTNADEASPNLSANQEIDLKNLKNALQAIASRNVTDSRQRRFGCEYCAKRFFTSTHRRQHVRIHTGEKPFQCDVCGCSFTQSTSLKIHKRKHTGERPYSCDVCGYTFYCSSDVLSHKKKRHGHVVERKEEQVDKYKCEDCDQVFPDISRLKTHKRKHTGEKPFSCDLCQRKFSEKHNLARHRERHLGLKAFQCDICGTKFTEKGNLKVHMRYHSGEKPFQCDYCNESFYVSSTLKIHRRKHTGERPFLCDLCGASFTQGGKLRSHRRKHTGEKPYLCGECGETFKEKQQLNIHQRKHTGVQPYTCGFCGKFLQKSSHLANHMRLHTGEKPYACEICGQKFSRTDVLGLHKRKHSADTQIPQSAQISISTRNRPAVKA